MRLPAPPCADAPSTPWFPSRRLRKQRGGKASVTPRRTGSVARRTGVAKHGVRRRLAAGVRHGAKRSSTGKDGRPPRFRNTVPRNAHLQLPSEGAARLRADSLSPFAAVDGIRRPFRKQRDPRTTSASCGWPCAHNWSSSDALTGRMRRRSSATKSVTQI